MQNLINAVKEQIGDDHNDYLADVAEHGADAGFPGFTYYADTVAFYDDNKLAINELVRDYAEEFGIPAAEMVANFNGVYCDVHEVDAFLLGCGDEEDETHLKNALAWFALEEVARAEVH